MAVGDFKLNNGEATILYSSDGGDTWGPGTFVGSSIATAYAGPDSVDLFSLTANSTNVIATGSKSTTIHSSDSGRNWTVSSGTTSENKQLKAVKFVDNSTAIAIGEKIGTEFLLLRSTDGGANWNFPTFPSGVGENLNAFASKGSFVIAVGDNATIISSDDSGANWKEQIIPTSGNLINVDIVNPVIIVGENGGILRSDDQLSASIGRSFTGAFFNNSRFESNQVIEVPFVFEWIFALVVVACAMRQLNIGNH